MKQILYRSTLILITVWLGYQVVNSFMLLLFLLSGLLCFLIYRGRDTSDDKRNQWFWLSVLFLLLSVIFTSAFWALLAVFLIVELNTDKKMVRSIRDPLLRRKKYWREKEFVTVDMTHPQKGELSFSRNKWFGDDSTGQTVFQWRDQNFVKLMGDSYFDLGNTLLPRKENIILIRKGLGDTKIIVPRGTALSLNISLGLGKLAIGRDIYDLKNETVRWQSEGYGAESRSLKITASALIGDVEVVYT
ncbi:Transporter associated with VraSR [Alkalibacterium sp. AK22]|uniref:cell wall-active antibiotics response protein LiaF n=1 Tax=Alkalibacterium sp. AK22 TaxID=1229520 RepID=UPI000447C38A|nr:cell wall-active antibiotics response protein LiaF [Alkalibacterium sp. AK22]EXJ22800.1 Transporter associated with VraSR [Alkalibacterium sp. AK22]